MTDIFLEIDVHNLLVPYDTLCIRKDYIVAVGPDIETGNANVLVLGESCPYHTTIPYDKFVKQFMVTKMKEEE